MATPEVQFARKLASNDLETRQKSERMLKNWLSNKAKKGMKETEMRVLWKGLFASMFMSDKPLVQEQLASDLSKLLHLFPDYNQGIKFCLVFFDTVASEWHGIDRLRLDKYYMFIRCFVKESFVYLQAQGWPEAALKEFMSSITVHNEKCPGLLLHTVEVFLPEFQKAVSQKLSSSVSLLLIVPWLQIAAGSKDKVLVQLVQENIMDRIVNGHKVKWLSLDWVELGSLVWTLSSGKEVLTRNRKRLHQFHSEIMERQSKST